MPAERITAEERARKWERIMPSERAKVEERRALHQGWRENRADGLGVTWPVALLREP